MAYSILAWPGVETMPPILGAQSLNHWTTRKSPCRHFNWAAVLCSSSLSCVCSTHKKHLCWLSSRGKSSWFFAHSYFPLILIYQRDPDLVWATVHPDPERIGQDWSKPVMAPCSLLSLTGLGKDLGPTLVSVIWWEVCWGETFSWEGRSGTVPVFCRLPCCLFHWSWNNDLAVYWLTKPRGKAVRGVVGWGLAEGDSKSLGTRWNHLS